VDDLLTYDEFTRAAAGRGGVLDSWGDDLKLMR
jgi:hypothetical protein